MNGLNKKKESSSRLLGVHVPNPIADAIERWVGMGRERTMSMFIREAVREKLRRDKIKFNEDQTATSTT